MAEYIQTFTCLLLALATGPIQLTGRNLRMQYHEKSYHTNKGRYLTCVALEHACAIARTCFFLHVLLFILFFLYITLNFELVIHRLFATTVTYLNTHHFSGGAFESFISMQLLKK